MKLSIREYQKGECITFKSTKGKFGALSNMAPTFPLYINSNVFKTSEALYQALRFPFNPEIQDKIITNNSPMSAKKISRNYIQFTRPDWEYSRFPIMKFCLEVKLFQNYDRFSSVLLATEDLPIVEYSDKDKVWGAMLQGDVYIGVNALGRYLMELRERVKTNNFFITVPQIENLKVNNQYIEQSSIIHPKSINNFIEQRSLF